MIRQMVGLALALLCARAGGQVFPKSKLDRQRDAAHSLEPARLLLRAGPRAEGEPRVIKLRVYATRDYRAQTFDWSARFRRLVARINGAAAYWPGARFEIVEMKPWERDSSGVGLERLLGELEAYDPGRDVDCVVGLAVAVPSVPEQIHELGMARPLGRHFVLRSLHDLAEYQALQGAFDEMSAAERDRLLFARKAHKEAVVFLHEWAHTLGLIHAQRWDRIMNPNYHHGQSLFSEPEAKMVELALRQKDAPGWRGELARQAEREPDPEWDPRDRDQLLALLAATQTPTQTQTQTQTPTQTSPAAPLAPAERELVELAVREANQGQPDPAFRRLQPLLDRHPDDARLFRLGCQLAASAASLQIQNRVCARAVELASFDPWPLLAWADGQRRAHLDGRADELLARAERLLGQTSDVSGWHAAAELRRRLDEPTLTVADARQAGGDFGLERWAAEARRRTLLPADSTERGLPPHQEGEYVRLVILGVTAAREGKVAVAEQLSRQLDGAFPRLPAAPYLRCVVGMTQGKLREAARQCEEALARQKDAIPPHDVLAELARRRGDLGSAAAHRQRAAELARELSVETPPLPSAP